MLQPGRLAHAGAEECDLKNFLDAAAEIWWDCSLLESLKVKCRKAWKHQRQPQKCRQSETSKNPSLVQCGLSSLSDSTVINMINTNKRKRLSLLQVSCLKVKKEEMEFVKRKFLFP